MRTCSVEGCGLKHWALTLCKRHYMRQRKLGTLGPVGLMKAPNGSGSIDDEGYRTIFVRGRRIKEHRYVMEKALGRKLLRSEHVHHKNHDRADNRIENLEIISPSAHNTLHKMKATSTTRSCPACRQDLPRSYFHGTRAYCKKCAGYRQTLRYIWRDEADIVPL